MKLEDLFVSYKQVDPVEFNFVKPILPQSIYLNLDRAQKAANPVKTTPPEVKENMSDWIVQNYDIITDTKKPDPIINTPGKSWNNPYKNNREKWIEDMTAAFKRAGLNDNAIKNLLAHNSVESNWGSAAQGAYNFGNIIAGSSWKGDIILGNDTDKNGKPIKQKFRVYRDIDHYVADKIKFLTELYDFNPNDDLDTYLNKLQGRNKGKRKYAENPQFINIIKSRYNQMYG